jgi:3'-phosphoadenosine 5'-phosphosulfate sulfotransferase (PAPS reductase)/FAD synthetase
MTEYHCKYDELVDPNVLPDHPRNVNKHPRRQLDALSAVIWGPKSADGSRNAKHALGWRHAVVVSRQSGFIVMGHARKTVAIEAGELVPVCYQDFATEADERAMLRADNRIAELAEIDFELEQIEIKELAVLNIPVLDFGFEIEEPAPESAEEQEKKEVRVPFGDHRDTDEILSFFENFNFIVCMFSGGKDSIAMVLHLLDIGVPREKLSCFSSVAPMDPPGLSDYLLYCEEKTGLKIKTNDKEDTSKKFYTRLAKYGYPSRMLNWCNTLFKVETFKSERKNIILRNGVCCIGNRSDESSKRSKMIPRGLWDKMPFVFPIFDFSVDNVRDILLRHEFKIHPVYKTDGRMSCMQCYNQGPSGWAALRKHWPGEYQKGLEFFSIALESEKFRQTDYCRDFFKQIITCEDKENKSDKFDYPEDMFWEIPK